jgi:TolB protein
MILRMILLLSLTMIINRVHAEELTIEVTKGVENTIPIAIVPFASQGPVPEDMAAIISQDLRRSGRFEPLSPTAYQERPGDLSQVNFAGMRDLRVDDVVVGQVTPGGSGYQVQFQLGDVLQGSPLLENSFNVPRNELRRLAHHISDLIYEKLTGEPGAFDTRIAYITAILQGGKNTYNLVVADVDGHNPHVILSSEEPIMSPSWSPDGEELAYVSFEGHKAQIIVQDVYSGKRQIVSSFSGINGAPSWAPDGQRLVLTLSKDGNPEIYILTLANGGLTRLTNSNAINTEPVWSPDGNSIVFTSDRGGNPQLYRVSPGGQPERLTFEGDYNAAPAFSPDGRYLAMVHRQGGKFYIAVMDMQTRQLRVLTEGGQDESPSFAPNGRMIIYSTVQGGHEVLAAVSVDGRVHQNLGLPSRDVREPAWSPRSR